MGNNNSMVSVMFEEIKGLLTSIDKRLDERTVLQESFSSPETKTEPKAKTDTVKSEHLIRLIAAHLQDSERKICQFSEILRESEKHVLSQMEQLRRITISQKPDSKIRHYHVLDLKSSKVVVSIVSLSVLLMTSLISNFHQFEVNSRMIDNDLKYRYIKSTNGISPENLSRLENMFLYNPDKKHLREIRSRVDIYEQKIRETTEKIERERMNKSN
jgi:hypothetical protein